MNPRFNDEETEIERATTERLVKLRTMPVDTTRLEKQLRELIPPPDGVARPRLTPWAKIAAALVLAASVAAWFGLSARQASASPDHMAQMHRQLVADPSGVMQAASIEAAGSALAAMWPSMPELPEVTDGTQPPKTHVMACCLRSVKDKRVACVLLHREGIPVTMVVAKASDLLLPRGATLTKDGTTYHLQSSGGVNMAMAQRGDRWVCVMGELPSEWLVDLAAELKL